MQLIYDKLLAGAMIFNPSGEAIKGNYSIEQFFLKEFEYSLHWLAEKQTDPTSIDKMFAAMRAIYNGTCSSERLSLYYELAAPVYAVSLIANGYNLPRSQIVDLAAKEVAHSTSNNPIIIDIACGVGLQGQHLAQLLENREVRHKVTIIGIDPSSASLEQALTRRTLGKQQVYDQVYATTAQDLNSITALATKKFDVMLSIGAIGGYITPANFAQMLMHPGFSSRTTYCFSSRVYPPEEYFARLPVTPESVSVSKQSGYDRTIRDSSGEALNRDYTLIAANCRIATLSTNGWAAAR